MMMFTLDKQGRRHHHDNPFLSHSMTLQTNSDQLDATIKAMDSLSIASDRIPGCKSGRLLVLTVLTDEPVQLSIVATYPTYECSWRPSYSITLDTMSKNSQVLPAITATITGVALLEQRTLQDWPPCSISISSACTPFGNVHEFVSNMKYRWHAYDYHGSVCIF